MLLCMARVFLNSQLRFTRIVFCKSLDSKNSCGYCAQGFSYLIFTIISTRRDTGNLDEMAENADVVVQSKKYFHLASPHGSICIQVPYFA